MVRVCTLQITDFGGSFRGLYIYVLVMLCTSEAMVLSRKPMDCAVQVENESLSQVKEFKYLWVLFTSEGRTEQEISRRIGAAGAVLQSLCCSVVTKRELSRKAKLSVYRAIFVPTLTYGHEGWS